MNYTVQIETKVPFVLLCKISFYGTANFYNQFQTLGQASRGEGKDPYINRLFTKGLFRAGFERLLL